RVAGLHATIQVTLQPVGAGQENLLLAPGQEVVDPAVFQEAADDRAHMDVVGDTGNARAQAAHAAHDQVDAHPGLAGLVQRLDHLRVGQRVDLDDDVRRLALAGRLGFPGDQV